MGIVLIVGAVVMVLLRHELSRGAFREAIELPADMASYWLCVSMPFLLGMVG